MCCVTILCNWKAGITGKFRVVPWAPTACHKRLNCTWLSNGRVQSSNVWMLASHPCISGSLLTVLLSSVVPVHSCSISSSSSSSGVCRHNCLTFASPTHAPKCLWSSWTWWNIHKVHQGLMYNGCGCAHTRTHSTGICTSLGAASTTLA